MYLMWIQDIAQYFLWCFFFLFTVATYAPRKIGGPVSDGGAGKDAASDQHVTRVTAVLQYCANWEQADVGVSQISWTMLHNRRSYATFKKRQQM